jgi:15-cis-phytoene synthase
MQPQSPDGIALARADAAACRAMLKRGSRNFAAAAWLLPRSVREPATALYAFCRLADDAIDEAHGGLTAVTALRGRLSAIYSGQPTADPADRAFASVVARFDIPRALPEALLEGFEWDARARRYETPSELYAYAARVAGSVGAMMAVLMGVRDRMRLARACELGIAMQLTNIARDVGEDARAGRLYLPAAWLREAGLDARAWVARPTYSGAIGSVVRRVLAAADVLYRRADIGIAVLPPRCRPGIRAARKLYSGIGDEIARRGYDSVSQRASTTMGRKLILLLGMFGPNRDIDDASSSPVIEEARFLVDAVDGNLRPAPTTQRRSQGVIGQIGVGRAVD